MVQRLPSKIGGYVLAGGKSSRMGVDKALLELAAKPLALHAVIKLRRVCSDVHLLSNRSELDVFAPIVKDLHPGCGPLGGIEAALEHSTHTWNLFLPVDVPFLPTAFLDRWIRRVVAREKAGTRLAMFTVGGFPQPLLCLLHKDVARFVRTAVQGGDYKVSRVLEDSAKELAALRGLRFGSVFQNVPLDDHAEVSARLSGERDEAWMDLTAVQRATQQLWFANLNTPEQFAEAERNLNALDT